MVSSGVVSSDGATKIGVPERVENNAKPDSITGGDVPPEGSARWKDLYLIYIAIVADAITSNIMSPYASVWVKDTFHLENEAFYAGLQLGVFSLAVAISSPFLGWWSDIVGRKYLLLLGLSAVAIFNLVGGAVGNYWVALAAHGMAGLLDSTQSVAYAAIGDLAKGPARQIAFGYSAVAFQVARILSSVIGGFTYSVQPADHLGMLIKGLPGGGKAIVSHVIASLLCVFAIILLVLFYHEQRTAKTAVPSAASTSTETVAITIKDNIPDEAKDTRDRSSTDMNPSAEREHQPPSTGVITPSNLQQQQQQPPPKPSFIQGVRYVASVPLLVRLILVYSLSNFLNGGLMISIPLLAEDYRGFMMTTKETGILLLMFGLYCIVFNFTLFKPLVRRLGQKRANALGFTLTAIGLLGMPATNIWIPCHTPAMWVGLTITCIILGSGFMMLNSILASLISSHASSQYQGVTQGVSRTCASIMRGVGPIVQGSMFEWSIKLGWRFGSFFFLSVGYIVLLLILAPVPREVLDLKKKQ